MYIYPPAPLGPPGCEARVAFFSQTVNIAISTFNIVNLVLGVLGMSIQCCITVSSKLPD